MIFTFYWGMGICIVLVSKKFQMQKQRFSLNIIIAADFMVIKKHIYKWWSYS